MRAEAVVYGQPVIRGDAKRNWEALKRRGGLTPEEKSEQFSDPASVCQTGARLFKNYLAFSKLKCASRDWVPAKLACCA